MNNNNNNKAKDYHKLAIFGLVRSKSKRERIRLVWSERGGGIRIRLNG